MFNKFALVITGLMLTVSSVGCCCLGGYGYGSGYRSMGGCPPCNNSCPPAAGYYPQSNAFAPNMDAGQTAYAPVGITPTAYAPNQSAFANSTAAMPAGAIPGPTIMYNAALPSNTLPTY